MSQRFSLIWEANGLYNLSLRELANDGILKRLCPMWWKPEGRIMSEPEQRERARSFVPCRTYAETFERLSLEHAGETGGSTKARRKLTPEQRAHKLKVDRERYQNDPNRNARQAANKARYLATLEVDRYAEKVTA